MVCSGAADETLRFWNVFASEGKRKSDSASSSVNGISGFQSSSSSAASLRIR
jgi:hypothetical protein